MKVYDWIGHLLVTLPEVCLCRELNSSPRCICRHFRGNNSDQTMLMFGHTCVSLAWHRDFDSLQMCVCCYLFIGIVLALEGLTMFTLSRSLFLSRQMWCTVAVHWHYVTAYNVLCCPAPRLFSSYQYNTPPPLLIPNEPAIYPVIDYCTFHAFLCPVLSSEHCLL